MDVNRQEQEIKKIIEWAKENQELKTSATQDKSDKESKKTDSISDINKDQDTKLDIEISKNQMEAFIFISSSSNNKSENFITYEYIKDKLKEAGVICGIDDGKIKDVLANQIFNAKIRVAKGKEAVPGKDGKIKYKFNLRRNLKPRLSKDGKADFHNLDFVTNVSKGQLLAEVEPPTKGLPGKTVTGKTISVKNGKLPKFNIGSNVVMSKDSMKAFSVIDGQPIISGGKLSVIPVLEVKGDVGTSTGNINFLGTVIVNGSVKSGFKIEAKGDVEVRGVVESAEIIAEGNIILKRGMQGRGKGYLKAGQNIIARYIENTTAEAGNNIHVSEAIMHSCVFATRKIILDGKKGLIVGGKAKAGEELIAKTIGSPMATYTELEIGVDTKKKKELQKTLNTIDKLKESLSKARKAIQLFQKLEERQSLSSDKKHLLDKLISTEGIILKKIQKLKNKSAKLEDALNFSGSAKVSAYDVAYTGVNIFIRNSSLKLKDKISHVTFYNYEGQIKFGPFEG